MTAATAPLGLASSRALTVCGDVYQAAAEHGLIAVETTLLPPPAKGRPCLVVVRVQAWAGDRTRYVALYDTAAALGGVVEAPRNWGGREAVCAHLGDVYVWVVGDPVITAASNA